jgi:hypothetical protein
LSLLSEIPYDGSYTLAIRSFLAPVFRPHSQGKAVLLRNFDRVAPVAYDTQTQSKLKFRNKYPDRMHLAYDGSYTLAIRSFLAPVFRPHSQGKAVLPGPGLLTIEQSLIVRPNFDKLSRDARPVWQI